MKNMTPISAADSARLSHRRLFRITTIREETKLTANAVKPAIAAVQEIYQHNFFPEMKASWKDYPEHIGHKDWPGCVRCHDDKHTSGDGQRTIGFRDCNTCHQEGLYYLDAKMLPPGSSKKNLELVP